VGVSWVAVSELLSTLLSTGTITLSEAAEQTEAPERAGSADRQWTFVEGLSPRARAGPASGC